MLHPMATCIWRVRNEMWTYSREIALMSPTYDPVDALITSPGHRESPRAHVDAPFQQVVVPSSPAETLCGRAASAAGRAGRAASPHGAGDTGPGPLAVGANVR